ncbi:protein disulfide-isomerase [Sporothrix brasiliensis 5110]|uniref:Protein disulfide-isomerase n=1 Tax=Sporothrix brasiliensis 5110 TaxID=1398154 RepID=A0A0C2ESQ0_9PEZI|nr:protein disulfide-isomerase [Sporothrix brasiliensis 5110]KIH89414.1 protein disulfide-isomerase [Sporothrix brasiliensis 5110]
MRLSSLLPFLGMAVVTVAADDAKPEAKAGAKAEAKSDDVEKPTIFDGIKVPPLINLTPKNFEEQLNSTKYLYVKHYSPYCHHCKKFAPAFQTTYEYYYTEKVEGRTTTSAEHYGIKFGQINCVAFFDLCFKNGIQSYPTTILYGDRKKIVDIKGVKNGTILSHHLEGALDRDFPGERPAILYLPGEGDSVHPRGKEDAGEILDKAAIAAADKAKAEKAKANKEKAKAAAEDKEVKKTDPTATEEKPKEASAAPAIVVPTPEDVSEKTLKAKDIGGIPADKKSSKGSGDPKKKTTPPVPLYRGPPKPTTPQNPNGASVPLTAETFQTLVTMTQDTWFIKFYAPWCHHCKAMAANWEQLAKEMQGKLNIGEVNCEKESRLCKDVRVHAYPTIVLFRGGERVDYEGLRGLGDFVSYANKALDAVAGVQDVNAASFEALEAKEEVVFVYFYDFATTSEDFMALERLPLSLIGHAKLVKTNDPALYDRFKITTWPRLLVSREGRPTYYPPLTPHEMRDTRRVLDWMKSVWLPIVPELTASNAREIMDGKLVVLGILKREDKEAFAIATREMKSAASEWMDKQIQLFQLERQELRDAKQLRIEEAEDRNDQRALRAAKSIRVNMDRADKKEVTFAWVDGAFWQRWVRTTYGIDIKEGERVIINDEDNRRYWDITSTGNPILPSRTSILETLNKITQSPPKIKPKLTISAIEKLFFDIRMTFSEHPYLSIGCVLGISLGVASWLRGRIRRNGGSLGHFRLDEVKDYKLPMLSSGVNPAGKND